jgi:transcriptional regulator
VYVAAHFEESRPEVLQELIATHPLGALVTLTPGGLDANHIPFEFAAEGPHGMLRGHVARANRVWQDVVSGTDALVIFQGAQSYITPSWYVGTKPETGKVVPTYNYCVVHAHGPMRVIDDPAWLRAMVTRLTQRFESGRAAPWQVSDAPQDFITKQLAAIVGIEIPITRLVGKWKVSQNRPDADRAGVATGLAREGAAAMADLVRPGKASA